MKLSLSWLKEHLPLKATPSQIAEALTLLGVEVDKTTELPLAFTGVIVGEVVATHKHPNAERLSIAHVFDGKEQLQIVCGASNCRAGIHVALARIGAELIGEEGKTHTIKRGRLREVDSFGMLCSEKELGLGEGDEGILELSSGVPAGTDLKELFGDTILELSVTPNLGHCLSVMGIARELAAHFHIPLIKPNRQVQEKRELPIEQLIHVEIEQGSGCAHYACRVASGVKVAPSPSWLRRRLEAAGLRSVNNVVDISNYVMLETGQPLHIFDYDTLRGKKIRVGKKTPFPTLTTLDGMLRKIPEETLLIMDAEMPIAFAGVMGGEDAAVTGTTTRLLIEAARFSPEEVRRTCKQLGLRSDASHRFERGTDPLALAPALDHAALLVQQIAGGEIAYGTLQVVTKPYRPAQIRCRPRRVNALLGTSFSIGELLDLFKRLDIHLDKEEEETLYLTPPSYRNDIKVEIDLVEEAARLFGYHNIPRVTPRYASSQITHAPLYLFEREVRTLLARCNLMEVQTCDLISPELAALTKENSLPEESILSVLHPASIEQSVLRTSLLPGLLQVAKHNIDHQNETIAAFEIGRIHYREGGRFQEPTMAALLLAGSSAPYHWDPKPREVDFFDLKAKVEALLRGVGVTSYTFTPSHLHSLHPGRQASVHVGKATLGALGEVHPAHLAKLGIRGRLLFAEINLHDLLPLRAKAHKAEPLPLYPGSERDWTITLAEEVSVGAVLTALSALPSRLLEGVFLLDLYKSEQIGKDRRNVTLRFLYRDREKTVAQELVDREHARITESVAKQFII